MSRRIKIEKLINPAAYFLIILALVLFFGKKDWWPSFYAPNFYGWAFIVSVFLIILPKLIFKAKDKCQRETLILLRAVLALILILNALGEIYFYQLFKYGIHYDKIIHFANSFMFFAVFTAFIISWYGVPLPKAVIVSVILVLISGFLWEAFEFSVDWLFKTKEFGINGQFVILDTTFDILFDSAGIATGWLALRKPGFAASIIGEVCHSPATVEDGI